MKRLGIEVALRNFEDVQDRSTSCRSWAAAVAVLAALFRLTDWKVCPFPLGQAKRVLFVVLWAHQAKFFTPSLSASFLPSVVSVAAAVRVVFP